MAKLKIHELRHAAKKKPSLQVVDPSLAARTDEAAKQHLAMAQMRLKGAEMSIGNMALSPEVHERYAVSALCAAGEISRVLEFSKDKNAQKNHNEKILADWARKWCSCVASLLRRHHQGQGELPKELTTDLETLFELLADGIMPEPFSGATKGSGARKYHPQERRDIQAAVDYIAAAKAGLLDDKSPAKTIKLRFAVDEKTVRRWVKENKPRDLSSFSNPQEIAFRASQAAAHYSTHGRSAPAINRRGSKR
jgi:hypothetical protein